MTSRTSGSRWSVEDGEYRINNPPDALVVPATWFAQRFSQVSLYYFDRTGSVLVPEPVFVPLGDQLATSLVTGLVAGRARTCVASRAPSCPMA